MCSTSLQDSKLQHLQRIVRKHLVAAKDYSSSVTINRLKAALASTQSRSVVSRSHRVGVYAPRAMRRCAKLIDNICHDQSDGGASPLDDAGVLALVAGGKKGLT